MRRRPLDGQQRNIGAYADQRSIIYRTDFHVETLVRLKEIVEGGHQSLLAACAGTDAPVPYMWPRGQLQEAGLQAGQNAQRQLSRQTLRRFVLMHTEDSPLEAAAYLYEHGMYEVGLAVAQGALDEDPDNGRLWELCGLIHRVRQEFDQALHALEVASLLVPLRPVGQFALAECYGRAGHHELAQDLYTSLLDWPDVPTELLLPIA
jgi:tetratricopeptide (TPR) repeat protein